MGQNYKEIAEIAQKRREKAIPQEYLLQGVSTTDLPRNVTGVHSSSGHFTAEELQIIGTEAEGILSNVKERKWTTLEVTKAFCKSAVVAQQLVRPLSKSSYRKLTYRAIDELFNGSIISRSLCQSTVSR